jgi:hypothetical protein
MIHTGSSQTSLFVDLLKEAEMRSNVTLTENQESYTVFMLIRNLRKQELLSASLALSYLESFLETKRVQESMLTDTADAALILAGLFPERARKLNVTSSYFLQISKMCFINLADICEKMKHKGEAALYEEIGMNVEKVAQVLYAIRTSNPLRPYFFNIHHEIALH